MRSLGLTVRTSETEGGAEVSRCGLVPSSFPFLSEDKVKEDRPMSQVPGLPGAETQRSEPLSQDCADGGLTPETYR